MSAFPIVCSSFPRCFQMASKLESCLTKLLYDGRINGDGEGSQAAASDSLLLLMEQKAISADDAIGMQAPVATDSATSCKAPPATPVASSEKDCVLLNAISFPFSICLRMRHLLTLRSWNLMLGLLCMLLQGRGDELMSRIGIFKINGQCSYLEPRL
jgi:anti-sigma factor ChrR (cupin superfamily)